MRAFLSLFIANLFLVGGTGLLTTFISMYVAQQLQEVSWVGVLSLSYYVGLLVGPKIAYYLISSVGHIRCFTASTAVVIACVALHGISDNLYLWLFLRLFVGIAMMSNFMVLESWLNDQTAEEKRGQVFSIYMITSYLGMVIGQFALSYFPALDVAILFLICMAIAIGIVPISTTRRIHPRHLKPLRVSVVSYFRMEPQALITVLFAGSLSGSFYVLAPVYAEKAGFNPEEIGIYMATTVFAGMVAQWPMGILSDKFQRSRLIIVNTVAIFVISSLLAMLAFEKNLNLLLTFAFGLFGFTLYPLASALANSRVKEEHRIGISSALIVFFGIGAGFASLLIAQLMSYFGHQVLYIAIALLSVVMYLVFSMINARQKSEQPEPEDYVVSGTDITASPLASSMDPRIDESTAEEQLLMDEEQTHDEGATRL